MNTNRSDLLQELKKMFRQVELMSLPDRSFQSLLELRRVLKNCFHKAPVIVGFGNSKIDFLFSNHKRFIGFIYLCHEMPMHKALIFKCI